MVESVWFDDGKDLSNPTLSGKVVEVVGTPVLAVETVTEKETTKKVKNDG